MLNAFFSTTSANAIKAVQRCAKLGMSQTTIQVMPVSLICLHIHNGLH